MPRIFIGSSTKGLNVAEYLQAGLARVATCKIWTQGVFGLTQGTLENLVEATKQSDFAILVLTPDDLTTKRGRRKSIPRDNVVFELGLFMGALGRERTFIVHGRGQAIELPSDLAGITTATFPVDNDDLESALGEVCTRVKNIIGRIGNRRVQLLDVKSVIDKPLEYREVHRGLVHLCNKAVTFTPDLLVGINRGGAVLGGMIGKRLGMMIHILEVTHRFEDPGRLAVNDNLLKEKRVLLIDDRLTTGNNMRRARDYLQQRGATVYCMVFALLEGLTVAGLPDEFAYKVSALDLPFPWEPGSSKEWK